MEQRETAQSHYYGFEKAEKEDSKNRAIAQIAARVKCAIFNDSKSTKRRRKQWNAVAETESKAQKESNCYDAK